MADAQFVTANISLLQFFKKNNRNICMCKSSAVIYEFMWYWYRNYFVLHFIHCSQCCQFRSIDQRKTLSSCTTYCYYMDSVTALFRYIPAYIPISPAWCIIQYGKYFVVLSNIAAVCHSWGNPPNSAPDSITGYHAGVSTSPTAYVDTSLTRMLTVWGRGWGWLAGR